ncbi:hypothetical protein PIB30_051304 [Stylosanthes scabra]|uniref:Uncharacterized protein n=1 Tax=Stylosanthes scabra TaxID=79078 RepID=A0ABU6ZGQ8_9FABA|nr:hypothetical protein [Stylosanthes scabra]
MTDAKVMGSSPTLYDPCRKCGKYPKGLYELIRCCRDISSNTSTCYGLLHINTRSVEQILGYKCNPKKHRFGTMTIRPKVEENSPREVKKNKESKKIGQQAKEPNQP